MSDPVLLWQLISGAGALIALKRHMKATAGVGARGTVGPKGV